MFMYVFVQARRPVGNYLAVQYKEAGEGEWKEAPGKDETLTGKDWG